MTYFNPNPKPFRVKLKAKDKTELKRKLYFGRANRRCETCGKFVPLKYNGVFCPFSCANLSHNKHGAQKEDTEEGCKIECFKCHDFKHRALKGSK